MNTNITEKELERVLKKYSSKEADSYKFQSFGTEILFSYIENIYKKLFVEKTIDISYFLFFLENISISLRDKIEIDKQNFLFENRDIDILDIYSIIKYEVYTDRLFANFYSFLRKNNLEKYLLEDKYFLYSKTFSFKYENGETIIGGIKDIGEGLKESGEKKGFFAKKYKYFQESDLKDFFSSVNITKFLGLLKEIYIKYDSNLDDNFLKEYENILRNVSNFSENKLPVGVFATMTISNFYLWMILFIEKENLDFFIKNNEFSFGENIQASFFNDDFVFFSDSKYLLQKKFYDFKELFSKYELHFSLRKTKPVLSISSYFLEDNLSIKKDASNFLVQTLRYKRLFLEEFKKDISLIDIKKFRKYTRSLEYILRVGVVEFENFLTEFLDYILLETLKEDNDIAKKIIMMIIIKKSFMVFLFQEIHKRKFVPNSQSFEKFLLEEIFEKHIFLLSDGLLFPFHMELVSVGFVELGNYIRNYLLSGNGKIINSLVSNETKGLKLFFEEEGFNGVSQILYEGKNYNENILGIYVFNIFREKYDFSKITNFVFENKEISLKIFKNLVNFLSELVYLKNSFPNSFKDKVSFSYIEDNLLVLSYSLLLTFLYKEEIIISLKTSSEVLEEVKKIDRENLLKDILEKKEFNFINILKHIDYIGQ